MEETDTNSEAARDIPDHKPKTIQPSKQFIEEVEQQKAEEALSHQQEVVSAEEPSAAEVAAVSEPNAQDQPDA